MPHDQPLLVVHQGALGDFAATFPVFRALGAVLGPLDGILRDSFGRLAQHLGLIRHYQPLEAARFASLYNPPLHPDVRRLICGYRRILLLSFSATLEASVRTAARRVIRIPPWPSAHERVRVARYLADRLAQAGVFANRERRQFETALTGGAGPLPQAPRQRVLLAPGAGSPKKRWPLSNFLLLAESLEQENLRPAILLGPAEEDLETLLAKADDRRPPRIRPPTLTALAETLAEAGGFIGNDSAAGHLAAFMELPAAVLFGPSDPMIWMPWGPYVRAIQPQAEGSSCRDEGGRNCDPQNDGMARIAPIEVLDAFFHVYRQKYGGAEMQNE